MKKKKINGLLLHSSQVVLDSSRRKSKMNTNTINYRGFLEKYG